MLTGLSLRVRIFLFFALLVSGAVCALATGLWLGYERLGSPDTLDAFVQGGLIAGFAILGLIAWVWFLFDTNVAKPIEALAGALRARAHSDVSNELDSAIAQYLGDLAPAASAAARRLAETQNALAEAVARETGRLEEEKARLERLLSDVSVGVVMCSADHVLAFYNGPAADLLSASTVAGLNRPLFDYLRDGPVRMAYSRLVATGDEEATTDLLCTTLVGTRVLLGRMRLLPASRGGPGYVLTMRDVTADMAAFSRRETLLAELFDRIRRPAANLTMLIEASPADAFGSAAIEKAFRAEVSLLSNAVTELGKTYEEGRSDARPFAQARAADLADGLKARLESAGLTLETRTADLLLRCNGFEVIQVLAHLGSRIAETVGQHHFSLRVEEDDSGAMVRLCWPGQGVGIGLLDAWLSDPLDKAQPEILGRSVVEAHATEVWPEAWEGGHCLCLPIPQARRVTQRPKPISRKVVYDFDLLSRARTEGVSGARLSDLTFVVFDTETTGLLPQQGDEIVQIAAVRIVNGRRIDGEVFDTLVNPGRTIPPASTEIHGITDGMVADAPSVAEAVERFHRFAEGAVLVAHNAPFDMQFLRRREGDGRVFDHPILDTVLLSAVIFGQHDVHSLDALCRRLGISIPEEDRHTAIGDTIATADAFLKLLNMLHGRRIETFDDVLTEVRKHRRLLQDLN